jgi:hypothetical protein
MRSAQHQQGNLEARTRRYGRGVHRQVDQAVALHRGFLRSRSAGGLS